MSIWSKLLQVAIVAGVAMLAWTSAGVAQENVCAAQDPRQACSFQCCCATLSRAVRQKSQVPSRASSSATSAGRSQR